MMPFISSTLFSNIKNTSLNSRFANVKKNSKNSKFEFDKLLIQRLEPKLIFEKLKDNIVDDLDLLQTFTLMGWEDNLWKTHEGRKAMQNWWLSALKHDEKGDATLRNVMTLRVILADKERYPAPKDVIQIMRSELDHLIQLKKWPYTDSIDVLQALVSQNPLKLAEISFNKKISVLKLIKMTGFPEKLPIIKESEENWLELWLSSDLNTRKQTQAVFKTILKNNLSLERQIEFAMIIFTTNKLPKSIEKLRDVVANYFEITEWLMGCAKSHDFRIFFDEDSKKCLICWIGTGNYKQFEHLISEISIREIDVTQKNWEEKRNAAKNRYLFWINYQHILQEAWLFIPLALNDRYKDWKDINNIIVSDFIDDPKLVIHIGKYFFSQKIIGKDIDLLMFNDNVAIDNLFYQNITSDNTNLCLIHDMNKLWQSDCAYVLESYFDIKPINNMKIIYNSLGRSNLYKQKISEESFKKDRSEQVGFWLKGARHRWSNHKLQETALTAKRYKSL